MGNAISLAYYSPPLSGVLCLPLAEFVKDSGKEPHQGSFFRVRTGEEETITEEDGTSTEVL